MAYEGTCWQDLDIFRANEGRRKLQAALERSMNPSDCNGNKILVWAGHRHGIGSQIRSLMASLAFALKTNRALIVAGETTYVDKKICNTGTLQCYFKPISHCSLESIWDVKVACNKPQDGSTLPCRFPINDESSFSRCCCCPTSC